MSVYATPIACWSAAIAGLIACLLLDGWGDLLGLSLLAYPLALLLRAGLAARRRTTRPR